jgi:TolA-binding protein
MRNHIAAIASIVLVIQLAGCTNDQYAIEQQYWKLQKRAKAILINPDATPPQALEKIIVSLNNFIRKYRENPLAIEARFNIARLYNAKKEFDKARGQLKGVISEFAQSAAICSEATFLIGYSYQLQERWDSALAQYKKIMKDYPTTLKGLDVPIYIAQYYRVKVQPDKMISAYKDAIAHYRGLAAQYPNSAMAFITDKLAAQCQVMLKDWQQAAGSYEKIISEYKGKVDISDILLESALIYYRELKNKARAQEILKGLLKDYPKSRFAKVAATLLKEMEKNK